MDGFERSTLTETRTCTIPPALLGESARKFGRTRRLTGLNARSRRQSSRNNPQDAVGYAHEPRPRVAHGTAKSRGAG